MTELTIYIDPPPEVVIDVNLSGPPGAQGPQGIQGEDGPEGPQGIQGPIGPQGDKGEDSTVPGPTGPQGDKGDMGEQGPAGPAGPEGPEGVEGPQGEQGLTGPQGVSGPEGMDGPEGPQGPIGLTGPEGPTGPIGQDGEDGVGIWIGPEAPVDPDYVQWVDTDAVTPEAALKSKIGNLLTDNQASVETDASGWAVTSGSCTISQVPGGTHGDSSLQIVSTGAQSSAMVQQANPANTPIIPGNPYTFVFTIAGAGPGRSAYVNVLWRTEDGIYISSTSLSANGVTTGSTPKTFQGTTALPPENARRASIQISVAGAQSGETFLVDRVGMWMGAGGDWNLPGTPITGLGTRITRPNVDDRLVEQWNGSAWSLVGYDSGWRNVSASVTNATLDSGGALQMRRVGTAITIRVLIGILPSGAGLGSIIYNPPSGFRASGQTLIGRGRLRSNASNIFDFGIVDGFGVYVPVLPPSSMIATLNYITEDSIPTSLPGTLVSPAPQ